jgi:phage shock protein PspC (stress-responsive transcriptional regulator)
MRKNKKSQTTKKDSPIKFVGVIAILAIVSALLSAILYGLCAGLSSAFSIASTIISILLSVVAIAYTWFSTDQISESLKKIEEHNNSFIEKIHVELTAHAYNEEGIEYLKKSMPDKKDDVSTI